MLRSCVHTHTRFCDGADSPEEMVQAALALDFVSLGFSGHGHSLLDPAAMSVEGEAAYRDEILRLQEAYGTQIEILLGQEHEGFAPYSDYPYEYLIESLHWIKHSGQWLGMDWSRERTEENVRLHFGGDYFAYCQAYYEACAAVYEKSPAQICGHLDLLTKFNEGSCMFDMDDPRYLEPARQALRVAVERGMVVELNTGAIARGYRVTPYPIPALLRHLLDIGGQVIVTADCHDRRKLACWYDSAEALLRELGFTHTMVLRKDGFREQGLL